MMASRSTICYIKLTIPVASNPPTLLSLDTVYTKQLSNTVLRSLYKSVQDAFTLKDYTCYP
jgi:hypothetical protein